MTPSCSAEAVRVKQSINTFSLGIPMSSALSRIFFAMATRSGAVLGIPFSSSARPTTQAPYFLTSGRTLLREFSSPFTELTIGLPQYILSPASKTSGIVLSICRGTSHTDWIALMASTIMLLSSISGSPTLTSSISAPPSICSSA